MRARASVEDTMATKAYHRWVEAGRPWTLARPIRQLRDWAAANSVQMLGTIGNEAHLTSDWPQDHTPFSFTAWPVPLPGYIVTAIDLADADGLGGAILANARADRYPWLKYMNVAGKNYSYADGFKQGSSNPDHHIHISVFSDELDTSILPFEPQEDDMPLTTADVSKIFRTDGVIPAPSSATTQAENPFWSAASYLSSIRNWAVAATERTAVVDAKVDAIAEALEGIVPGILAAVQEAVASVTAEQVADELEIRVRQPVNA